MSLSPPGSVNDQCGRWGCGSHGQCVNTTCQCENGWSGSACHVPPQTINVYDGDSGCGNWGVAGTLTLNRSGLSPMCDCSRTSGMFGSHCERECETDSDCGHGVGCDTSVGRCFCTRSCTSDSVCEQTGMGVCSLGWCTEGWTDVGCATALGSGCVSNSDCGPGGTCIDRTCVCAEGWSGLRCERAHEIECVDDSGCASQDKCVPVTNPVMRACYPNCPASYSNWVCQSTGYTCVSDADCAQVCVNNQCTASSMPERVSVSDPTLLNKIDAMVRGIVSQEGLLQLVVEEKLEDILSLMKDKGVVGTSKIVSKLKHVSTRYAARSSQRGATANVLRRAAAKTTSQLATSAKHAVVRRAVQSTVSKYLAKGASIANLIYFVLEIASLVLDLDDSAGYNAQLTQDNVDAFVSGTLQYLNSLPELRDANVGFPRVYLPSDTLEWTAVTQNEVVSDRAFELADDYLHRLTVNSNGERITWYTPATSTVQLASAPDPTLWYLSGNNDVVYSRLQSQWWLLVIVGVFVLALLVVIIVVSINVRKHRQNQT